MKKIGLIALIEAAFFAAMALVLDLLPSLQLSPSISISFAMVPIFIIAFRWGFKVSFISGFLWGLLQIVTGDAAGSILHPLQGFLEYFVAFAFIGFAGLFYQPIHSAIKEQKKLLLSVWIIVAVFVGSLARYFWHFLAGFIFWGHYAPEGMNAVLFSLVANGTTMLGAFALCSVVLVFLVGTAPRLIRRSDSAYPSANKKAS